jgi:hypothetical protein
VGQIAGEILVFSSNHVTFHLFFTDSILFDPRDNNHKVELPQSVVAHSQEDQPKQFFYAPALINSAGEKR